MLSLRVAFLLWRGYNYYWIGSNSYQYLKSAYQCYYLTHPTIRWCYKKIYNQEPKEWTKEQKKKEYRLLAELSAIQEKRNIELVKFNEKKEKNGWIVLS